jgi:hypothetical protein
MCVDFYFHYCQKLIVPTKPKVDGAGDCPAFDFFVPYFLSVSRFRKVFGLYCSTRNGNSQKVSRIRNNTLYDCVTIKFWRKGWIKFSSVIATQTNKFFLQKTNNFSPKNSLLFFCFLLLKFACYIFCHFILLLFFFTSFYKTHFFWPMLSPFLILFNLKEKEMPFLVADFLLTIS